MEGNIFETLDAYFSVYKDYMDEFKDTSKIYDNECKFMQIECKEDDHHIKYIKDKCLKWFPYLFQIHYKSEQEKIKGLQYMYYWIYRNYTNQGIIKENIITLYKCLIKRYNDTSFAQVTGKPPLPDSIKGQQWEILIDICNLNTALNEIKNISFESSEKQGSCYYLKEHVDKCIENAAKCKSNASPNVCKIFENIKSEINQRMSEKGCYNINNKIFPLLNSQNQSFDSSRTNNSGIIIISTVLTLLTPMLVFILYKVNYD
ncbi:variable surface protein, partial [Plasmodium gonderi]